MLSMTADKNASKRAKPPENGQPPCFEPRQNLKHEFVAQLEAIQNRARIWDEIPVHVQGVLDRYIKRHLAPGYTIRCLLEMDFEEAHLTGDPPTRLSLPAIVEWLNLEAPRESWGSKDAVDRWLSLRNIETPTEIEEL